MKLQTITVENAPVTLALIKVNDTFIAFCNVCQHACNFRGTDGEEVIIPPSGRVISAEKAEAPTGTKGPVTLVKTTYSGKAEDDTWLKNLASAYATWRDRIVNYEDSPPFEAGSEAVFGATHLLTFGSAIAAGAFPEDVVAMTPAEGTDPRAEKKLMSITKFASL